VGPGQNGVKKMGQNRGNGGSRAQNSVERPLSPIESKGKTQGNKLVSARRALMVR